MIEAWLPQSASGHANWHAILKRTLPYVDIFIPSIEEILFMLRRDDYDKWRGAIELATAGRVNADNGSPELREELAGVGGGDRVAELDDGEIVERQCGL